MAYVRSIETAQAKMQVKPMFAVYETTTGQIVASFYDRRKAESHAFALTEEFCREGYEYAVMHVEV